MDPAAPTNLPHGWVAHFDSNTKQYYYHNAELGQTTWTHPGGSSSSSSSSSFLSPTITPTLNISSENSSPAVSPGVSPSQQGLLVVSGSKKPAASDDSTSPDSSPSRRRMVELAGPRSQIHRASVTDTPTIDPVVVSDSADSSLAGTPIASPANTNSASGSSHIRGPSGVPAVSRFGGVAIPNSNTLHRPNPSASSFASSLAASSSASSSSSSSASVHHQHNNSNVNNNLASSSSSAVGIGLAPSPLGVGSRFASAESLAGESDASSHAPLVGAGTTSWGGSKPLASSVSSMSFASQASSMADSSAPLHPSSSASMPAVSENRLDSNQTTSGEGETVEVLDEDNFNDFSSKTKSTTPEADENDKNDWGVTAKQVYCTRLFVSLLAVGLLWCTSLNVANEVAAVFFRTPASQEIYRVWGVSVDVAVQEHNFHLDCARQQTAACFVRLNRTATALQQQYNARKAQAALQVQASADIANQCSAVRKQSYSSMQLFISSDPIANQITNLVKPTCNASDVDRLSQLLGDIGVSRSSAYSLSQSYQADNNATFTDFKASIDRRTKYDHDYLRNKTGVLHLVSLNIKLAGLPWVDSIGVYLNATLGAELRKMQACLALDAPTDCPTTGLVSSYKSIAKTLNDSYQLMHDVAVDNYNRALEYQQNLQDTLSPIKSVYDYLATITDALAVGGIDFSLFPAPVFPPVALANIPGFKAFKSVVAVFSDGLKSITPDLAFNFTNITAAMKAQLRGVLNLVNISVDASIPNLLDTCPDYCPPKIIYDQDSLNAKNQEYLSNSKSILSQKASSASLTVNVTKKNAKDQAAALLPGSSFQFQLAQFGGSVLIGHVFDSVGWTFFFLLFVDYMWRVYSSIRIFWKYWRASTVGLPIVDCRKQKNADQTPGAVKVARVASNPFVIYAVLAAIFASAIVTILASYAPLYQSYQDGCVKSSSGTGVTKNAYAFAYNYAAADGNTELTKQFQRYDSQRTDICGQFQSTKSSDSASVQNSITVQQDSRSDLELLLRCIDPSKLPSPNRFPYQFNAPYPLSADLSSCDAVIIAPSDVADTTFNCSALVPCTTTCTGPNSNLITATTHEAGCKSESLVHAVVYRFFVGFVVYVCFNISRSFTMAATVRLFWRALTPYGMLFVMSCSRSGYLLPTHRMDLLQQLVKVVIRFRRIAVLLLIGALLVHIPYLIMLTTISNPVDDHPYWNPQATTS